MLDASAAVEIALWTATGSQLAEHLQGADEVVVPDHFHLECAGALRRLELRGELSRDEAQAAFDEVFTLRVGSPLGAQQRGDRPDQVAGHVGHGTTSDHAESSLG